MTAAVSPASAAPSRPAGHGLRWWRELIYIVGFYVIYSMVRNTFGSAGASGLATRHAFGHALDVIHVEERLRLFVEPTWQRWYLDLPGHGLIRLWNVYYGTAHFVVTIAALVVLFRRDPDRYPTWRNTLAFMTLCALVGFASFTLMPPRLLGDTGQYGACHHRQANCHGYRFVDTLEVHGGLWSFDSGGMAKVSNQYAAMPSLHTGWSAWCAFVLWPMLRRRKTKALILIYPVLTVFCILITANHYWLDAVGGLVVFAVGYLGGAQMARWSKARRQRRDRRSSPTDPAHGRPVKRGGGEQQLVAARPDGEAQFGLLSTGLHP